MDLGKLREALTGQGVSTNLSSPDHFYNTGNYALNFTMTGHFTKGIPNRRSTLLVGPSGTGKSFLAANAIKYAQEDGATIIYIDTEDAIHEDFMTGIGVDMSPEKFVPVRISTIEEATKVFSEIFKGYKKGDRLFIVVDSLTNLETEMELKGFSDGTLKADQGRKAKMLKQLVANVNNKLDDQDIAVLYTGHVYINQDLMNGKGAYIVSGGEAFQYLPSVSVLLKKKKLKDEDDKKKVNGFIINTETLKSRFTVLGQRTTIEVPWDRGMNPNEGMLEFLLDMGVIKQSGAWYSFEVGGETVKFQGKKGFEQHAHHFIDEGDMPLPEEASD